LTNKTKCAIIKAQRIKKDLWGGHAPARGWIKGRKRIKPTPQINHKKKFEKNKKSS